MLLRLLLLVGLLGFFVEVRGQQLSWKSISTPKVAGRSGVSFDALRNVTVFTVPTGEVASVAWEVYEWDGAQMVRRTEPTAPARLNHAQVYDAARARTVVFGGRLNAGGLSSEMWTWDGESWEQLNVVGPTAVESAAMTFDSARGVVVLHGGLTASGARSQETWEWNGVSWTLKSATGPGGRADHAMVYDPVRNLTVLFGGSTDSNPSSADTWTWDGTTWTRVPVIGPDPMAGHGMAFDESRGFTVLFGSRDGTPATNETWEFNGTVWTRRPLPSEFDFTRSVQFPALTYDRTRQVVVGGASMVTTQNNQPTQQVMELAASGWQRKAGRNHELFPGAMVFDESRGTMVFAGHRRLFYDGIDGRKSESIASNDWSNGAWSMRPDLPGGTLAPTGLIASTYDSRRGRVVLFGGQSSISYYLYQSTGDTIERIGNEWVRRDVTGPDSRYGAVMAFDSRRNVSVLLGGWTTNLTVGEFYRGNTTYEYDGMTWRAGVAIPSSAVARTMAFDTNRGVMVLRTASQSYMTIDSESGISQTWEYDGVSWILRSDTSPFDTRMTYHAGLKRVVAIRSELNRWDNGSYDRPPAIVSTRPGQLWEWDGATWTGRVSRGPSGIYPAYDPERDGLMSFGSISEYGYRGLTGFLAEMYELNLGKRGWIIRAGNVPEPTSPSKRGRHVMAFDSTRQRAVLFGGWNGSSALGDTWTWDGSAWTSRPAPAPSPRFWASMCHDPDRGVTTLYGGQTGTNSYAGDVWEWNGAGWTQRFGPSPGPRASAAMVYDSLRRVTVLYGGATTGGTPQYDTWHWNGSAWMFHTFVGPPARTGHAMAFDVRRGKTIMFGGYSGGRDVGDTWEWDGTSWTRADVAGPPPRSGHQMYFDPAMGRIVMHGGSSGTFLGDTWAWDGMQWTQINLYGDTAPPPARAGHALAFDSARGTPVMHGGHTFEYFGDTWEIGQSDPGIRITRAPQPTIGCLGKPASFTVETAGLPVTGYQWKVQYSPALDGNNIVGATSATLTIPSVSVADEGYYSCEVRSERGAVITARVLLKAANPSVPPCCSCRADFDESGGTPDILDIDAFFNDWLSGAASADSDCSGGAPDSEDIDVFFAQWLAGGC